MKPNSLIIRWFTYTYSHAWFRWLTDITIIALFVSGLFFANTPLQCFFATMATYRLALMVIAEEGPFLIFVRWRKYLDTYYWDSWIKVGFSCILCLSFWISWIVVLLVPFARWQDYVLQSLTVSCGCVMLNKIMTRE